MSGRARWWRWFLRPFRRPGPDYTAAIVQRWTILNDDEERLASRPVSGRMYRSGRFVPNELPGRKILGDADALAILDRRARSRRMVQAERLAAEHRARDEAAGEQAELLNLDLELPPWEE